MTSTESPGTLTARGSPDPRESADRLLRDLRTSRRGRTRRRGLAGREAARRLAALVACQVGTAVAARTQRASLRRTGLLTNPLLGWGIAFELAFAAAVVALPAAQRLFSTAVPEPWQLALLLPMPVVVWGVDEVWRWRRRRSVPAVVAPGPTTRP